MPIDIDNVRRIKREYMARKRAADPEAAREYQRNHHAQNRTKSLATMRAYYAKRFFLGKGYEIKRCGEGKYQ